VIWVAAAVGALAIGAVGWQLGRARDGGGAAGPVTGESPTLVAPAVEPAKPQGPSAEPPAPAAPSTIEAPATAVALDKTKPVLQARPAAARVPANKPDGGAKSSESDASKANPKRPGGLIEDVPF
jgi:hypothetical protein